MTSLFLHGGGEQIEPFVPFVSQGKRIAIVLVSDTDENDIEVNLFS